MLYKVGRGIGNENELKGVNFWLGSFDGDENRLEIIFQQQCHLQQTGMLLQDYQYGS